MTSTAVVQRRDDLGHGLDGLGELARDAQALAVVLPELVDPEAGRLRVARGGGVPVDVVLGLVDLLALDRVEDDRRRLAAPLGADDVEEVHQLRHIMAVAHVVDGQVEGAQLVGQRLEAHVLGQEALGEDLVVVDDEDDVVQLVVAGRHEGLPDGALVALAVAHEHVDHAVAVVRSAEPHAQRASHGDARDLAQGAAADLDPGRLRGVGVRLQARAPHAVVLQALHLEVVEQRHDRVDSGTGVALREVEDVAHRPVRIGGVEAQHVVEEDGQEFRLGEAAARMPQSGAGHLPRRVRPDEVGQRLGVAEKVRVVGVEGQAVDARPRVGAPGRPELGHVQRIELPQLGPRCERAAGASRSSGISTQR